LPKRYAQLPPEEKAVDKRYYFERNLLALSARNPALCSRLSAAETTLGRYRFLESRSGEIVPALTDHSGAARPLHSTIDPRREAERLVATLNDEGFVAFLGLGGGYAVEAALAKSGVFHVAVIEYGIDGVAELFCSKDYVKILGDSRFSLLIDPAPEALEEFILEQYQPALCGGIRTLPLRTRTEQDIPRFNAAAEVIQQSIKKVSADYSVQAHFGKRWFANIIRNLRAAEAQNRSAGPVREAAVCAAGPSLEDQFPLLEERKAAGAFVISSDTALPALLRRGIAPDAAVSIDCQHISYYHFMECVSHNTPLFLDIASPPLLASFSAAPFFFSGGHPLARYISRFWRPLPLLDTSGGNVTHACLSLAENLGADHITLFGADFSYPEGRTYARGTYVYPYFERKQNRLAPLEALHSAFLYRAPFLPPEETGESGAAKNSGAYYETGSLRFYRKKLEEKAAVMEAAVSAAPGRGAPVTLPEKKSRNAGGRVRAIFAAGRPSMSAACFLEQYRDAICALPNRAENLSAGERRIFTTLLPQAAALKRGRDDLKTPELIEAVKRYSADEIERVLAAWPVHNQLSKANDA
jgi:hypothetical protein